VRTIVSFELRYNPFLKFARWLQAEGWLGRIRFARTQYLSNVTDWYSGWEWVRTKKSGRSHLLAAGCHAVDALRFCSGLEPTAVSALHTHFTDGYEWPTSIMANMTLEGSALGHVRQLHRLHAAVHDSWSSSWAIARRCVRTCCNGSTNRSTSRR
jgi:predicted dehydrogenase